MAKNPKAEPIYSDRDTGERFPDARDMIKSYLQRYAEATGRSVGTLDASGYAEVTVGGATVGVNVLDDRGVLMIFAPIMKVPVTGREALFRRLLDLSFVATSDAAFAVNAASGEVVARVLRRLSALDYEEFEDLVATVGAVADAWRGPLERDYGT